MTKGKDPYSGKGRGKFVRVKTARGRKSSSTRWLQRQLNDPFVARAKKEGYRSRAVYKLMEMDDKYHFLKPGSCVVDLGAAPGSWCQIALERIKKDKGYIVGIDLLEIEPIEGVTLIQGDFLEEESINAVKQALGGKPADVVMSDMAAAATGHPQTDHLRIMALCETALDFALEILRPGGVFLAKVLQGGAENQLLTLMKQHFSTVKHIKPQASRKDSSEMYVIALNRKDSV